MVLKTYNNTNIKQLGICTVKMMHKDNVVTSRFFVVLGNSSELLGMPDIEVLGILKITCEVLDSQQAGRKFDSKIM